MRYEKRTFLDKAKAAWGDPLPDWIESLARECDRANLTVLAKRLDYSKAVISHALANTYSGDLQRVEEKVRGALLGATVMCPVFGEMARDYCLDQQKMGNTGASSVRTRLYRNCRGIGVPKCPNSRIPDGGR